MAAIIRDDAEPLPPSVPTPLRWVIDRLLAKDPEERYDSTRDLYRELKLIRDRLSQTTTAGEPVAAAPPDRNRKRGLFVAPATGMLAGFSIHPEGKRALTSIAKVSDQM
jgi:hypothetical protein